MKMIIMTGQTSLELILCLKQVKKLWNYIQITRRQHLHPKKHGEETTRDFTVGVYLLRVKDVGFNLDEIDRLTTGMVMDAIIEKGNDNEKYPKKGSAATFKAQFGGA